MGETSIEPVSGTSFIVLLMLLGVFLNAQDLLDLTTQDAILLGLVGTTVFGSAISMSGTVIGDYKIACTSATDLIIFQKGILWVLS